MRIRQIKPSWFLDKELRKGVSAEAREFYVGLWMIADDAGWFVWDAERIAAELYPYGGTAARERNVVKWAESLMALSPASPHLVVYSCGHALVQKMPGHQRIAGKVSVGVRDKHRDGCREVVSQLSLTVATTPGEPTMATDSHGRVGKEVGNGTERNGTSREATPHGGGPASEFQARVPRPFVVVAK